MCPQSASSTPKRYKLASTRSISTQKQRISQKENDAKTYSSYEYFGNVGGKVFHESG